MHDAGGLTLGSLAVSYQPPGINPTLCSLIIADGLVSCMNSLTLHDSSTLQRDSKDVQRRRVAERGQYILQEAAEASLFCSWTELL
jgi:hypothetical protein